MSLTIPAPPYLGQIFYQTKGGHGFSESYWINGTDYTDSLEKLGELVELRRPTFTASHRIIYTRVSDSQRKRDTLVTYFDQAGGQGTYVPAAGDTVADDVALLMRFEGFDNIIPYFVLKYYHLIPEECVTDNVYTPTAAFEAVFGNFLTGISDRCSIVVKVGGVPAALAIDDSDPARISRRKAGRPFGQSRGRSLAP